MSRSKLFIHFFNCFKPQKKIYALFGVGIGVTSLATIPYNIQDENAVANVNGVFRFIR